MTLALLVAQSLQELPSGPLRSTDIAVYHLVFNRAQRPCGEAFERGSYICYRIHQGIHSKTYDAIADRVRNQVVHKIQDRSPSLLA